MNYTSVSHCGNDHLLWLKSMDFYDIDLNTLENRLAKVANNNNSREVMAEVEHFQNQFIIQRNNIDELRHTIHEHESKAADGARAHAGRMENNLTEGHNEIKEQFESFERVMNGLRHEFNRFLAKWI